MSAQGFAGTQEPARSTGSPGPGVHPEAPLATCKALARWPAPRDLNCSTRPSVGLPDEWQGYHDTGRMGKSRGGRDTGPASSGSPAPPAPGACPAHGDSAACPQSLSWDAEQDPCASNQRPRPQILLSANPFLHLFPIVSFLGKQTEHMFPRLLPTRWVGVTINFCARWLPNASDYPRRGLACSFC